MHVKSTQKIPMILILIVIGFFFRLFLAVLDFNGDIFNHVAWGKDIIVHGMNGFYERDIPKLYGHAYPNYPPIAMISFAVMNFLYNLVWPIIWNIKIHLGIIPASFIWFWEQQKFMLPAFTKLPAILADLFSAYFIYLILKKIQIKKQIISPLMGASLVLFNPVFFYNSAYWGQIDSFPLCFMLASIYYLFYLKKPVLSAILFTLALLSKQTVAIFIPLFVIVFIKKTSIKEIVRSVFFSLILFFMIFFPFTPSINFIQNSIIIFTNKVLFNFGSDYLTAHAFNFWGLTTGLGHIRDLEFVIGPIPARYLASILVGGIIVSILFILHKQKYSLKSIYSSGYLIPLTMFLFSTRMHERHLLLTIPFLLIASAYDVKVFYLYIFVSIFHFLNLYNGWWSPHPPEILISILGFPILINFLIICLIFLWGYFLIQFIKNKNE